MGNALRDAGRLDEALASYRSALKIDPELVEAHSNLGNALIDLGHLDDAVAVLRLALQIKPDFAKAHFNLGNALRDLGQLEGAVASYRMTLKINPDLIEAHINLGNALRGMTQLDGALTCYRHALKIKPDYADAYINIGVALKEQGLLDEASQSFESAIAINPDSIDAHFNLSLLKTYRNGDPHLAMLERPLDKLERVPQETRVRYWFALGKIKEDMGRYDDSFAAYREGNRLQHASLTRDDLAEAALLNDITSIFSREFFAAHHPFLPSNKTPIFIVGMPRSGTSLLEQILSSCTGVHGAGELTDMRDVVTVAMPEALAENFPGAVYRLSTAEFHRMGEEYIQRIWRRAPDATHIVDKMPANFFYFGMIHLMLPNAKIIHASRDPMDSCFSCYSHLFEGKNQSFTYDLETLGRYYVRYAKLMAHWRAVLPPDTMLEVRYEDMVADTEGQARRLLAYLGLPWDDRCLAFHQNKRVVSTASAAQVRRPIYKTSVARWRRFADQLAPLFDLVKEYRDVKVVRRPLSREIALEHQLAGRLDQAQAAYREILQTNPHDAEVLHQLGIIAHQKGDDLSAIELIEQAIVEYPVNGNAYNDLGGLFNIQGKLEVAISCMQHALNLDSSNVHTRYNLGCTLQKQGNLNDAEFHYRQALLIKPGAVDILCNLGSCLQEQGKSEAATNCYRQALALNPNDVNSLNNLGTSFQTNGKLDEAIACFAKAITIHPNFFRAYINLGMTYYDLGDFEKALSYYKQSLATDPKNENAHYCIGVALQALCKPKDALDSYRQAIAINKDNSKIHDNLLMIQLLCRTLRRRSSSWHTRVSAKVSNPR